MSNDYKYTDEKHFLKADINPSVAYELGRYDERIAIANKLDEMTISTRHEIRTDKSQITAVDGYNQALLELKRRLQNMLTRTYDKKLSRRIRQPKRQKVQG